MSSNQVKPTLYSALLLEGGETISLQFTEDVYLSTSLDSSAITINAGEQDGNNNNINISSVSSSSANQEQIRIELTSPIFVDEEVTFTYQGDSQSVFDVDNNYLDGINNFTVTNNSEVVGFIDGFKVYKKLGASQFSKIYKDRKLRVKVCFFLLGKLKFELVQPLFKNSPIDNLIKKKIRIYHVAFTVQNIDKTLKKYIDAGSILIWPITKAVALKNKKICFILTPSKDIIEFIEI